MLRALTVILLAFPPVVRADRSTGDTVLVAGTWFQYLGSDESNPPAELFLYPHIDGVSEVFRAASGNRSTEWTGDLGSRFDPARGKLSNRFSAAELLNELLARESSSVRKRAAARWLRLFVALHGPPIPYYVDEHLRVIDRWSRRSDDDWLVQTVAAREEATRAAGELGTRVPEQEWGAEGGAEPYYRELAQDGYLDVAIVGGNSFDKAAGNFHSWSLVDELRAGLARQGFEHVAFRSAADRSLSLKNTRLAGVPIQIRVVTTGASVRPHRVRRAVANLIEGLAHADVVIFLGHSNHASGSYFTSETKSRFSRFRIGGHSPRDLQAKCHGLDRKEYRIVALQSCSSYEKYCHPLLRHLDSLGCGDRMGVIGFSDRSFFSDIVPRTEAFLESIFAAENAREIHSRLQRIRPAPETPDVVMRGVLQPRHSFIVPESVSIVRVENAKRNPWIPRGIGDDGFMYASTGVFPQAAGNGIVQVLDYRRTVLGLSEDGVVYEVGADTRGAAVEWKLSKSVARFVFIARVTRPYRRPKIVLVASDGVLYAAFGNDKIRRTKMQAPASFQVRGIWNGNGGRLIIEDAEGARRVWQGNGRGFVPDASSTRDKPPPSITLESGVVKVVGTLRAP